VNIFDCDEFMKILLISHFFPPTRVGGAEEITLAYALNLQQRGHTVQVLCAGDWDTGQRYWNGYVDEIYQNVSVRRVNLNWTKAHNPNQYLYDNPVVEIHLDEWLELWHPDVVHIISLITLSASVIRSVKKHGLPVIFSLVDFWPICLKGNLVREDYSLCDGKVSSNDCHNCLLSNTNYYNKVKKVIPDVLTEELINWASKSSLMSKIRGFRGITLNVSERNRTMLEICRQIDVAIAPSKFLKAIYQGVDLFTSPIIHIPYGHDLSWLEGMPEKKKNGVVRIGFAGQISWLKGLHILIPAFKAINNPNIAQLRIYGDPESNPEYFQTLSGMIGDSKNISFMGKYAHTEIGEVLSGLDVIVVPSQWHENNPLVVQEAFASKTPVIGSNVGGISEFIEHDVNGLLFQYDSVSDLKVQIERVLIEPGIIDRLKNGIKPVKTIAQEMDEIESLYTGLITTTINQG
jgi:glycosyltransferase involved in cell wall biosynthesis